MTIKKPLSALLAAVMLCGLTGCGKNENSVPESLSDSTSDISSVSGNSSENVQSPTFDIEMDGQHISLPCKVKEINNITVDRQYSFSAFVLENGREISSAFFYYNGKRAGQIYLEGDCTKSNELDEENVIGLSLDSVPMSYMGLTNDSGRSDIVGILGEPDRGENTTLVYYIEPEGSVSFDLNPKDKVDEIWLYMYIR